MWKYDDVTGSSNPWFRFHGHFMHWFPTLNDAYELSLAVFPRVDFSCHIKALLTSLATPIGLISTTISKNHFECTLVELFPNISPWLNQHHHLIVFLKASLMTFPSLFQFLHLKRCSNKAFNVPVNCSISTNSPCLMESQEVRSTLRS